MEGKADIIDPAQPNAVLGRQATPHLRRVAGRVSSLRTGLQRVSRQPDFADRRWPPYNGDIAAEGRHAHHQAPAVIKAEPLLLKKGVWHYCRLEMEAK